MSTYIYEEEPPQIEEFSPNYGGTSPILATPYEPLNVKVLSHTYSAMHTPNFKSTSNCNYISTQLGGNNRGRQ